MGEFIFPLQDGVRKAVDVIQHDPPVLLLLLTLGHIGRDGVSNHQRTRR